MKAVGCKTIVIKLPAYCDGSLEKHLAEVVARHLAECAACRDEAEAVRRVEVALQSLSAPQHAPELIDDLHHKLAVPVARSNRLPYVLAAASFVIVVVAVMVWQRFTPRPVPVVHTPRAPQHPVILKGSPSPEQIVVEASPTSTPVEHPHKMHVATALPLRKNRSRVAVTPRSESAAVVIIEEAPSSAVVIVTYTPQPDIPPVSSYQAEVSLPDGSVSSLEQTITRHNDGTPRDITIVCACTPSENKTLD